MRRSILSLLAVSLCLGATPSASATRPAAIQPGDWIWISPDFDGDGLPNAYETGGWCNTLGCFTTNPQDADSDGDGLRDGEEKLFEAHPNSAASPGIFVVYEDRFKTKEYYPWQQYGHKLIARGDAFNPPDPDVIDLQTGHPTDLDAVVVRRGTTFYVGGPPGASLQIDKQGQLTNLSVTWDVYSNRWRVAVPSNGTVGRYRLLLGDKDLDVFVIFELPTPSGELTQQGINKFLYDDNPKVTDDEVSMLVYTIRYPPGPPGPGRPPYTIPSKQEVKEGISYKFWNHQYNRYLLEDYVMPAINGKTSQFNTIETLNHLVDAETVFRNPYPRLDSWSVLHPGANVRQQCSNVAGLLAAFSRAAGIASRPIIIDWRNSTFDHANEIWVNGNWYVYRGYTRDEIAEEPDDTHLCGGGNWPACGTNDYVARPTWGTTHYEPWHSGGNDIGNVLVMAEENWQRGGQAYRWASWEIDRILIDQIRLKTKNVPYWSAYGWTTEPLDYGEPGSWPPDPNLLANEAGRRQPSTLEIGNVMAESTEDADADGLADRLVLEVEVVAAQPGRYALWAQLSGASPALRYAGGIVSESFARVDLAAGTNRVRVVFDGYDIAFGRTDGPYALSGLWIASEDSASPADFINNSLAHRTDFYTTAAYRTGGFESHGARLTGQYADRSLDLDGDGAHDALEITTSIQVDQPGEYSVTASLFDSHDRFVGRAEWRGAGPQVTLRFDRLGGSMGPYTLRGVSLSNAQAQVIDRLEEPYALSAMPDLSAARPIALSQPVGLDAGVTGNGITSTQFSTLIVNGNLQLTAQVQVARPGTYRLEAWLADSKRNLVTYQLGAPTSLGLGAQSLTLVFGGTAIRQHGMDGPYTVSAVKILSATGYTVFDKVNVATTTPVYTKERFGAASPILIFEDNLESGAGGWTAQLPWSLSTAASFSASSAWHAANADAGLQMPQLNFSKISRAILHFQSAQNLGTSDRGYVQASTNGSTWTTLATFSSAADWSARMVDLSAYAGQPKVYVRFLLDSAGGSSSDGWYIDDALIVGRPFETFLPLVRK